MESSLIDIVRTPGEEILPLRFGGFAEEEGPLHSAREALLAPPRVLTGA